MNSEIDEIFELRMKIYEKYPELSEDYIDFKSLFKSNEMRAIKLIKFWLDYNINNKNKRLYKYEKELVSEESEIIIEKDEEIINMLLPSIPQDTDVYWGEWSGRHKFSLGIERTAVNIIKKANNTLIKRLPEHNGKVERSHRNDNERFYSYLKFYSLEDLIKQGRAYLKRSNNIPMAVLGYLTPKEKRAELELAVA